MPRKKAQARRHEVIDTHVEEEEEEEVPLPEAEEVPEAEEEEDDIIEEEVVKEDEVAKEVMDLTESSDDEIHEVAEVRGDGDARGMKRPLDGSSSENTAKVVRLDQAPPTSMNPNKPPATVAAYLEAQRAAARQRQDTLNKYLSSSAVSNQGYAVSNQGYAVSNQGYAVSNQQGYARPPVTQFDLLRQAHAGGMNYNQMKAFGPRPVVASNGGRNAPQTVDLTKESSSVGSSRNNSSSSSSTRNSSSSRNGSTGPKLVEEFESGFKCMRCLTLFPTRPELKYHIVKVHSDLLNFKCGKCGEVFSKQSKLEKHERNHGRDKLYVCVQCDSSFYQLENLKRHEKTHIVKKTYKCSGCTRTYTEMEKLVLHERIHKKNELPFQCEEENCGEGFHARGNLKMHIRLVHTKKGKKK